jgi:hypothetical protein
VFHCLLHCVPLFVTLCFIVCYIVFRCLLHCVPLFVTLCSAVCYIVFHCLLHYVPLFVTLCSTAHYIMFHCLLHCVLLFVTLCSTVCHITFHCLFHTFYITLPCFLPLFSAVRIKPTMTRYDVDRHRSRETNISYEVGLHRAAYVAGCAPVLS